MADMNSSFPNDILLYILSFLPTKQVVATCVLSKRWNLLWRSVSSFDFYCGDEDIDFDKGPSITFLRSVKSFLDGRERDQRLYTFRLTFLGFMLPLDMKKWIKATLRVQHLDLNMSCVIPSEVFSCKTLIVLKLANTRLKDILFFNLPLLKILQLDHVRLSKDVNLSRLLSGCPNLEELEVKFLAYKSIGKFIRLPKLVRASIHGHLLPLEIVKDVEVLFIDRVYQQNLTFDFQNLVQLEHNNWLKVLEVLKRCPKLQNLVICINKINRQSYLAGDEEDVQPYPQTVPVACISSHLTTCCLKSYRGSIDEFQFANYILENAKYLRTMKICTDSGKRLDMIRELSSCMKSSYTCTLSF